jgi:hypothetical protein
MVTVLGIERNGVFLPRLKPWASALLPVKWCESIDAVEQDLHNKVLSPSLNDGDRERDVLLDSDTATDILDHLAQFEYASLRHALLTLLWRCGAR